MTLQELEQIVTQCGGEEHARTYVAALLTEVTMLEARDTYRALLEPIRTARDQGDLHGRLLEFNLAYQFERCGVHPGVGAKQSGTSDIDFQFAVADYDVFLETKLLRQDVATTKRINSQLAMSSTFGVARTNDTGDIARLQWDLIQKANPRKFDTTPKANWINLAGLGVHLVSKVPNWGFRRFYLVDSIRAQMWSAPPKLVGEKFNEINSQILKTAQLTSNARPGLHLSPLGWEHINLTGDYHWEADQTIGPDQFQPLRTRSADRAMAA